MKKRIFTNSVFCFSVFRIPYVKKLTLFCLASATTIFSLKLKNCVGGGWGTGAFAPATPFLECGVRKFAIL